MTEIIRAGIAVDSASGVQNLTNAERAFNKLDAAAQKTNATLKSTSGGMRSMATSALGLFIGIGTVVKFMHDLTRATIEGEQTQAKLEAVLKATGFAAGQTAAQIDRMATSMSRSTLFDDETIKNASAIMLTFRNVQGDMFNEAIKLSADLSAVMGQDLQSSIVQVGKAFQDPIAGVLALRRVGVSFNESQKQQIAAFMKTNNLIGAQKIIAAELAREFGGGAGAANTGLKGALHAVTLEYDNFLESLGRTKQVGGPVDEFLRALSQGFRGMTLTTEPLEDMQIRLSEVQDSLELAKRTYAEFIKGGAPQHATPSFRNKMIDGVTIKEAHTPEGRRQIQEYLRNMEALATGLARTIDLKKTGVVVDEKAATAAAALARAQQAKDAAAATREELRQKRAKEEEERKKAIEDEIAALLMEASVLGLTARQAKIYELAMKGATDEQIAAADAALEAGEAFDKEKDRMEKLTEKAEEQAEAFQEVWKQGLRNTQDAFANFFYEVFTGGTDTFEKFIKGLLEMWARAMAQMLAMDLFKLLPTSMGGGGGAGAVSAAGGTSEIGKISFSKMAPSPAAMASATKSAGGGVTQVHQELNFNFASLDAPSTAALLESQQGVIAGAVLKAAQQSTGYRRALLMG